jgi:hypothetical protein
VRGDLPALRRTLARLRGRSKSAAVGGAPAQVCNGTALRAIYAFAPHRRCHDLASNVQLVCRVLSQPVQRLP